MATSLFCLRSKCRVKAEKSLNRPRSQTASAVAQTTQISSRQLSNELNGNAQENAKMENQMKSVGEACKKCAKNYLAFNRNTSNAERRGQPLMMSK